MTIGGIILAGGASGRMGTDKARLDCGGQRAIDRVFALAQTVCDGPVVVSGADYGLPFVADPAPLGGPVGGVLAAAAKLAAEGCDRALVLAVDAPALTARDLEPLLGQTGPGAVYDGLPLPMCIAIWAVPAGAQAGWPLRRLAEIAGLAILAAPPDLEARARGANDPAEWAALVADFTMDGNQA